MDKNAKILVAGGTGLVGINLIKRLLADGHTDIVATGYKSQPPMDLMGDERVDWWHGDLRNSQFIDRVLWDVKYLVIVAASTSGAATINSTPLVHVTPNLLINSQLLEAAHFGSVERVIWLSSTTGYPELDRITYETDMFDGEPYDKYYAVGWMKRYTEVLMKLYGEKLPDSHMQCIVLRPTNIYGPNDKFDPQVSHVLPALIKKVADGMDPIEVWGDGNDVRDLIYVDDMVDAIVKGMEVDDVNYGAYNIGLGQAYNVHQMLSAIQEVAGTSREVVFDASKPTMIKSRTVSIDKAKRELGWEPKVGLHEGVKKTYEWYMENEHGKSY